MKFKFPLQTVVKHRKILEDLAQREFLESQALLLRERTQLEKLEDDLHLSHVRASQLEKQGGTQGPALSQIGDFKKGQKIRIERQKVRVQEVEKLVEAKREILRQAAIEYKIIDKLKDKKFAEHQKTQNLDEQKEMDEQSILRFERNAEKRK